MPFISLESVVVPKDRHREDNGETRGLAVSIHERGLINPIILEKTPDGMVLRAGFRRFCAHEYLQSAGLGAKGSEPGVVEYREWGTLSELEREAMELEENIHRKQLEWGEEAKGIRLVHNKLSELESGWSRDRTAEYLGVSQAHVSRAIQVAEAIESGEVEMKGAKSIGQAHKRVARNKSRKLDGLLDSLSETIEVPAGSAPTEPAPVQRPDPISLGSFLEWAPSYSGPKFNLLHCDFPYGVNYGKSSMSGSGTRWSSYSDDPDLYWHLCRCLADNWSTLMADSSHIIFWLSMSKLEETWVFFREHLPQVSLWQNPLIWHKSDNKGVLADPDRGPRHTYEVALFGSTGDRKLVGAKADSYSAPTNRANSIHQSEKPQPMLEFFLSMVVDKHSRVFDPTAGSGSALRAAERLGADSILGLDVSEEYVTAANKAIKQQRALESLDA